MHPYVIAPHVVRVNLHKELCAQSPALGKRLEWKPLMVNLESCEEAPYLYFRVTLNLRQSATTYAGFATGAPFMLTRDKDVKKRAFFLRHWVRRVSETEHNDVRITNVPYVDIGSFENYLLVRVEIDRPLVTRDTFKSVPFATWMFQVVQLDAIIAELPHVRLAFAIERTITAEEREVVANAGHSIPAKGPKMKPQPSVSLPSHPPTSSYTTQLSSSIKRGARPFLRQSMQPNLHASPMQRSMVIQRPPAYAVPAANRGAQPTYQHNPYQYISTRQIQPAVVQTPAPRAQSIAPSHLTRPSQRIYSRSTPAQTTTPSSTQDTKLLHPYLKLWDDRDPDDPYEPIFITKDEKLDAEARRSFVIEKPEQHSNRSEYQNLYGIPAADYLPGFFDGPEITQGGGEADVEVVISNHKKPRLSNVKHPKATSNGEVMPKEDENYSAAVVAAAEYNALLRQERSELRKWLEEDAIRGEQESEEEEVEEDGDQDSSD